VSSAPIFWHERIQPSSKRLTGPIGMPDGLPAPTSSTCVTPAAQPTSSSSQKIGVMFWTSALWTSPMKASLLQKMSPWARPGLTS
jgi:hypothetical protein